MSTFFECGDLGESGTQLRVAVGRIGRADAEFEAGDRIVGDTTDGIDVCALLREFACNRSHCASIDRATENNDRVGGHRGPSGIGTDFDVDVHSDRRHRLFEFFLKRLGIVRAGDHDAECQSTSNHHLLHVE